MEPVFINTGLRTDILRGIRELANNDSANDLDRQYARNYLEYGSNARSFETADVVATMLKIIDAEEPVLRYPLPAEIYKTPLLDNLCDQTGEKAIAFQIKVLTGERKPGEIPKS